MNALEDIEDAYNLLFFLEFCIRAWAFEGRKEFWTNPVTAGLPRHHPAVLSFFEIITRTSPIFRFLRLLRVLRLLAPGRSPNSVLFARAHGLDGDPAHRHRRGVRHLRHRRGVIYDLEYTVNPNVNNLNDTLYWAILTLTGIGQPFEVVTAGGASPPCSPSPSRSSSRPAREARHRRGGAGYMGWG